MRVGNAASEQFQLDVYGEVAAVVFLGVELLGSIDERLWPRWRAVIEYVETIWRKPDEGIWEARGPRRHYTYSKVMAWVVFDRAVRLAEQFDLEAPLERWRQVRDEIHAEVCEQGYDPERRTFTQYYGSKELDASVLNIPLVGFLPGTDERVTGTIDAVSRELGRDGFVSRYSTADTDDGLPGDEGQFLACSFWLVSALARNGRVDEARALFERLVGLAQRPRPARRGVRRGAQAAGRQLPAGLQPPHADLRGDARSSAAEARTAPAAASKADTRRLLARTGARAVHLQLRGLEHERDDQRHQRGPGHDREGRAGHDHAVPADHGDPDDPRQQADRPLGPQALLHLGPRAVRRSGALLSAVSPGSRRADPRQLGARGRRHGLLIPPVYILTTLTFSDLTSRARAFGVISGLGGIGAAAGPLIGGVITTAISWRAAFVFQAVVDRD